MQAAWDYAMSGDRVSGAWVIAEEQIDFDDEITLLTVRALDGDGEIQTHFCEPIGHRQEQGDYVESRQPQIMSAMALTHTRNIAKKVTDSLGGRGLFGKPESSPRRRMGVPLAHGENIEQARERARQTAARISPAK